MAYAHPVSSCCRRIRWRDVTETRERSPEENPEQRREAIKAHIWTQHMPAIKWICFTPACGHINDSFFLSLLGINW